ncbi:MAG: hypothetical protein QF570_21050, partial [Myxococcota bacterium]|nr:hypothetical protein [Myxococcota bacterium]
NEDYSEDWDVAQWYQVLNVEMELDIIDDTTMGIDLMSAFVRLEVRYDCVYSHGCGMFRSINAWGDDAQSLPRRLSNGNDQDVAGELLIARGDRLSGATTDPVALDDLSGFRIVSETKGQTLYQRTLARDSGQDRFLAPEPGENCERGNAQYHNCFVGPTPFSLNFNDFEDYKFTQLETRTGEIVRLGPWLPKNKIASIGTMSTIPNPFDTAAINEVLFVGYVDHDGFRTDYLNEWEESDAPFPPGVGPGDLDATLETDPEVIVTVNMKFPEEAGNTVGLRLPLIQTNPGLPPPLSETDTLFIDIDAESGRGTIGGNSLVTLNYPELGVGGLGAKPYRPASIVDHDEAFYYGDDVEEIELNLDCERTSQGGSRCHVREVGATIEYDVNDLVVDIDDFNVKFQEYYRELQVANRTVCQTGDMACFETVFRDEMETEGFNVECGAMGDGCGVSLASVIEETFEEIESLDCLESEWNCSDQLIESVEETLADLEADGATLTCEDGVDCDVDLSKYLIRFGTHYVISANRSESVARGNFIPSKPLRDLIDSGRLAKLPFNISESERAWNRGYAQNDEKELKEAYLDIELMDSRLWLRIGKQSIVWGKTELFRTTDQFNPQDLALASLPSLEESRINLWAFRAVYSLYEIGPLSDVRVEFAFNFDDFQASDFGACGEAFTPNVVCQLTLGAMVHGMTGVGVAGIMTPPYRWYDPRGWEAGARIEWRWDRFSFALTDFWGYNDLPTVEFISHFERNVDPFSGRPRRMGHYGRCDSDQQDIITTRTAAGLDVNNNDAQGFIDAIIADGSDGPGNPSILSQYQDGNVQESCLRPGPTHREAFLADLPTDQDLSDLVGAALEIRELREVPGVINPLDARLPTNNSYRAFIEGNALDEHHANLNFFTWVCSSTVGFLTLDPNACAQTIFGSTRDVGGVGPIALLIGALVGGQPGKNNLLTFLSGNTSDFLPVSLPVVTLDSPENADPNFPSTIAKRVLENYGCFDPSHEATDFDPDNIEPLAPDNVGCGQAEGKLTKSLTPEQEALLGCGPFFGTNCDFSGLDLLNAEASAMLQSFVGIEGTTKSIDIFREQLKAAGRDDVDVYFRTDGWIPFLERETGTDPDTDATRALSELVDPMLQPGTVRWRQAGIDTPVCTTADLKGRTRTRSDGKLETAPNRLPGCRGLRDASRGDGVERATKIVDDYAISIGERLLIVPYITNGNIYQPDGAAADEAFYINEDFYQFHAYVAPEDAERDANGNIIDIDMDGIPDHRYRGVECSPDIDSVCSPALKGFEDKPEYHNQWDEGYKLSVDGSPFLLNLKNETGTTTLRLPGQVDNATPALRDRATPNCPTCPVLHTGLTKAGKLGGGHPFTGDLFTSEMAGFSFNFMMMLVAFDEDFQLVMDTITSGPTGNTAVLPREIGLSYTEPWYTNGPPVGQRQGNCHEDIRSTAASQINRDAENQIICGIERRRFAVHYAFSGNEWGTHDPDEEFEDEFLTAENGGTPFNLTYEYVENRFVGMEILESDSTVGSGEFIKAGKHCSFVTPQHCEIIQNIFAIAGVQNRSVKAGGSGEFGRRTFIWHSGGEVIAKFDRRNVLGLAMDFAEDVTKSNWGVEFTWVEGVRVADYDEWDGLTTVDDFNLTVSMDRPTFLNFLNPNKTFFLNTQWFFQYRDGYRNSMPSNGPINVLGLVFVQTGYFQDRLLPGLIGVYDFLSRSGAALPQVTYRYTESFSIVVGANIFMGRQQIHEMPIRGIGPAANQRGRYAYKVGVENGISLVRDRDEVFMRLRYTF